MAAFEYVYEIFTVTQLQFAITKSNKKFTAQACGRFCFIDLIYSIHACLFMFIGANVFLNKIYLQLLRTDRII